MKRICAWCGQTLGYVDSEPRSEDIITHGLCEDCAFHLFAQTGVPLQDYLDGLGGPIVVVDPRGKVKTANRQARALLQKDLFTIEGYKGGNVFECAYAELPKSLPRAEVRHGRYGKLPRAALSTGELHRVG
jgi:hypothetical protein